MKDKWDEFDDVRFELTEKAEEAERIANKLSWFFLLDVDDVREQVLKVITGEDDETDVDSGTE